MQLSVDRCSGTDKPLLTHLPMDPADFAFILPYGIMVGGHVTPVDHQYFPPTVFDSAPGTYNVYAMADSNLVGITTRTHPGQGSYRSETVTDYRLVFSLSCRLFYYYDLVNELAPGLEDEFQASGGIVAVTAGQFIGKIGNQTLDFAVWDTDRPLAGFVNPEDNWPETWKVYTADPLDYYADDIRAVALSKYVRTAEPRSGKIDYDVDGKLIGNWFEVGTDGYNGSTGEGNGAYWTGHLAFAPYFLDPSAFLVSIGNWPGGAKQFATEENTPDPATVGLDSGVVKYTLVEFGPYAGVSPWDMQTIPTAPIHLETLSDARGCMLVQLTGARALTAQAFPASACDQVDGFTGGATAYER